MIGKLFNLMLWIERRDLGVYNFFEALCSKELECDLIKVCEVCLAEFAKLFRLEIGSGKGVVLFDFFIVGNVFCSNVKVRLPDCYYCA